MIILGRILKYFLWFCFFALIGAFLFGLIKFKGNFPEYINYLNQINISDFVVEENETDEIVLDIDEDFDIEDNNSSFLDEEGYFLPENNDNLTEETQSEYGFVNNQETGVLDVSPSVSKEDLINLIKSREE